MKSSWNLYKYLGNMMTMMMKAILLLAYIPRCLLQMVCWTHCMLQFYLHCRSKSPRNTFFFC